MLAVCCNKPKKKNEGVKEERKAQYSLCYNRGAAVSKKYDQMQTDVNQSKN